MASSQVPAKRPRPADQDLEHDNVASAAMRRVSQTLPQPHTPPQHQGQQPRRRNPHNGQLSSRTGQACDRCKARKIRCDDTEGGCVPCRQSNSECKTTDRITQRATVRGHTENVERQNERLQQHIAELEQQLRELDVVPRSQFATYDHTYYPAAAPSNHNTTPTHGARRISQAATPSTDGHANPGIHNTLPPQQEPLLSSPLGTSLSVFGMKIDISRFIDPTEECKETRTSFAAFHASLFHQPSEKSAWATAHLPRTHQEFMEYAKTFIFGINPWMPSLHPPDFFSLVEKLYDGSGYKLCPAETVMVHMVLANSKYQVGMRNEYGSAQSKVLLDEAFAHYHHSLTFLNGLTQSRTLLDLQALCLVCVMARCFSSPLVAWFTTQLTLMLAVQVGLHRSLQAMPEELARSSPVTIQLRRCVFWSVYLTHVRVCSKLGHPLYLRPQDFDIEAPEAAETSTGISNGLSPGVSFGAVGYLYKLCELHADVHSTFYAVSPQGDYLSQLRSFEARLDKWRSSLPSTMVFGSADSTQLHNKPFACWALYCASDLDLAIHHPAACRTSTPEVVSGNLTACTIAASNIFAAAVGLRSTKSVDITWMSVTTLISALFTSLFAHWERRDSISAYDFTKLKGETETALSILSESGEFLRAGPGLRPSVQEIMERGLGMLSTFLTEKTAAAAARQVKAEPTSTNVFEQGSQQQYAHTATDRQQGHHMQHNDQPGLQNAYANNSAAASSSIPPPYQTHPYNAQFTPAFGLSAPIANGAQMHSHPVTESALMYGNTGHAPHQNAATAYVGNPASSWQSFADMNGGYLSAPQANVGAIDSTTANTLLAMNSVQQERGGLQSQQHMLADGISLGAAGGITNMKIEPTPWPVSVGFQGQAQSHPHNDQQQQQQ